MDPNLAKTWNIFFIFYFLFLLIVLTERLKVWKLDEPTKIAEIVETETQ